MLLIGRSCQTDQKKIKNVFPPKQKIIGNGFVMMFGGSYQTDQKIIKQIRDKGLANVRSVLVIGESYQTDQKITKHSIPKKLIKKQVNKETKIILAAVRSVVVIGESYQTDQGEANNQGEILPDIKSDHKRPNQPTSNQIELQIHVIKFKYKQIHFQCLPTAT